MKDQIAGPTIAGTSVASVGRCGGEELLPVQNEIQRRFGLAALHPREKLRTILRRSIDVEVRGGNDADACKLEKRLRNAAFKSIPNSLGAFLFLSDTVHPQKVSAPKKIS